MMDPVAGARAPLPIALLVVVAGVLAFSTDQPLVLGALAVGAVVLLLAAPAHPGRLVLIVGLISAAGVFILTPLVSGQGDLVLFSIPIPPPLNGEITAEEMGAAAAAAARLLATVALAAAFFAWADPDRMLAGVGRVAPRSALVSALAARLVPTLRRDAKAISETARLRGIVLSSGSRMARARRAAPLALPLVGSALERGLDVAEAMAARGYGEGRRTRLPERSMYLGERVTLVLAALLAVTAGWGLAVGAAEFTFFPTMDPVVTPGAVAIATTALVVLVVAALVLGSSRGVGPQSAA